MKEHIAQELKQAEELAFAMRHDSALCEAIAAAAELCLGALRGGGKILFAGNGGSAADAQHWAAELVGRFRQDRPGIAALALSTDTSVLTAIGNDYGFDRLFARQIEAIGAAGDVLVAISTSGRSANILRALETSRTAGIRTVGLTGIDGNETAARCDVCIRVPAKDTARVQEAHELIGHILCGLVEQNVHRST